MKLMIIIFMFSGSPIRCIAANRKFIVACCEDLTINCYNLKSGARPLPPLLIEDLVSSLSLSQTGYCLVLTKTGLIHMWNFDVPKNILSRVSVRSLLSGKSENLSELKNRTLILFARQKPFKLPI